MKNLTFVVLFLVSLNANASDNFVFRYQSTEVKSNGQRENISGTSIFPEGQEAINEAYRKNKPGTNCFDAIKSMETDFMKTDFKKDPNLKARVTFHDVNNMKENYSMTELSFDLQDGKIDVTKKLKVSPYIGAKECSEKLDFLRAAAFHAYQHYNDDKGHIFMNTADGKRLKIE